MIRTLSLWLAVVATVSCGDNLSNEPDQQFQARMDQAISAADTAKLAELAEARCQPRDDEARQICYEDYFLTLADSHRVRLALGALNRLGQAQKGVEGNGHSFTHVIGIRAWKPGDDVGQVFRSCTALYQSGCYHGVIQSYLTATGDVDSARTAGMCDKIAPFGTDNFLRFQCIHGVGHGLEMAWNWDLPRALSGCDWLESDWDQKSCYGGAIMENAVASSPSGHHTATRALEKTGDDHGEAIADAGNHLHDNMLTENGMGMNMEMSTFKMRDSSDALYPCDSLNQRYQGSCYLGHGGILLGHVDYDWSKASGYCDQLGDYNRSLCYTSLGTNAAGNTVLDTKRSIKFCNEGDKDWRKFCFIGVVKNFVDVSSVPQDGIDFCNAMDAGVDQDACFHAVGEQLTVLYYSDTAKRTEVCTAAGSGEAACRSGARLPPQLPNDPASPQN